MIIKEALIIAKEVISNPKHWVKNSYKQSAEDGLNAYCSVGALNTLDMSFSDYTAAKHCLDRMATIKGYTGIISFNDCPGTTHAQILELFDSAIAYASAIDSAIAYAND